MMSITPVTFENLDRDLCTVLGISDKHQIQKTEMIPRLISGYVLERMAQGEHLYDALLLNARGSLETSHPFVEEKPYRFSALKISPQPQGEGLVLYPHDRMNPNRGRTLTLTGHNLVTRVILGPGGDNTKKENYETNIRFDHRRSWKYFNLGTEPLVRIVIEPSSDIVHSRNPNIAQVEMRYGHPSFFLGYTLEK